MMTAGTKQCCGNFKSTKDQGFSLIEIMIVVLIIGISASMAVLYIDNSDDRLKFEAKRFFAMAQLVRDDALIKGHSLAMVVDNTSYYFARLENGKWVPFFEKPFKKIELDKDVSLRSMLSNSESNQVVNIKKNNNLLFFLPTGESSEFQVLINNDNIEYAVSSTIFGELTLKRIEKI